MKLPPLFLPRKRHIPFFQRTEKIIINIKENRCDRPGQRIAEYHCQDIRADRNSDQDPDNPQDAHAQRRHNHRNPAVSHTAQCAGINLNTEVCHKCRHQEVKNLHADRDYLRIRCEQQINIAARQIQDRAQPHRDNTGNSQADVHAAFHTVQPPRAVILSDKGRDGDPKRINDHPVSAVDLSICSPRRHRVCSQCIDAALDHEVGKGIHNRLESSRKPNPYDPHQNHRCDPRFPDLKPVRAIRTHQRSQYQTRADHLGKDRRHRRTTHAHPKSYNKQQIERNVRKTADHKEIERSFGITDRPQDSGTHII